MSVVRRDLPAESQITVVACSIAEAFLSQSFHVIYSSF